MPQLQAGRIILTALLAGILGVGGWMMSAVVNSDPTSVYLNPASGTTVLGETFVVEVEVTSTIPVNVFKGEVRFDHTKLRVAQIDYNTSIADLWAKEPWYQNGDGTLGFIGGTTHPGGFSGSGTLITITFETIGIGDAAIGLSGVRVLQHDGLGTDADVNTPIDAIFSIETEQLKSEVVYERSSLGPTVNVVSETPNPDLNNDGRVSMADVSIFMANIATQNPQADFNRDGKVSTADMSILLNAF